MLDALHFVQGAIARKDFVPEMTHFHIKDGGVTTYNGALTLFSPIALNFDVSPKADQMIKAIKSCSGSTVTLHLTPSGKLSIKSGQFRALIDCLPLRAPPLQVNNTGATIALEGGLLPILRKMLPFVAEDASRPWARGVLFDGTAARATNNIVIVEHWLDKVVFPEPVNLPKTAIAELLRLGQEPVSAVIGEGSITFSFEEGRWLRAQLYPTDWPDIGRVLKDFKDCPGAQLIMPDVWQGVEQLLPLADAERCAIYFNPSTIATHPNEQGAVVDVEEVFKLDKTAILNINQFYKLKGVADLIELGTYPGPCPFFGKDLRGAIVGLRHE